MAYTNNPYFLPAQEEQQIAGISPMMQNIAGQQATQQAAMAQAQQLTQAAGQPAGGGQSSAMALANALRKDKAKDPNAKDAAMGGLATYNPMTQAAVSSQYDTNPYSQQSRMLAAQEKDFL